MTGTRTSPLSVLRFLAVASVVVYHAYRFTPRATVVAPPPAGSVSDFVRGCVSLALMRWALPFLGLVSGHLFFRRLTPSLAGFLVKLRTRARTVLVPFLIWSGLGVFFAVAITNSAYVASGGRWAGARGAPACGRPGHLTVWLGFDALKGLLRPPAWLVAAGLFVAPLSFFVYVTQEPTLSVLKAFTRTPLQTYAQRSDGGSPALAIVLYLLAPSIAIAGSIGAALLLRRLVLRVCALMTGGRGPERRAAESPPVGDEAALAPSGS